MLVKFFFVIQDQSEVVGARLKGESAAGNYKKAFFADFQFVVAWGEIVESEVAGAVGLSAVDVGGSVFKF